MGYVNSTEWTLFLKSLKMATPIMAGIKNKMRLKMKFQIFIISYGELRKLFCLLLEGGGSNNPAVPAKSTKVPKRKNRRYK